MEQKWRHMTSRLLYNHGESLHNSLVVKVRQ